MNVLELFAGSRSFSKVAEELGHKTFTTDIKAFKKIDLVIDVLDLKKENIPFVPDVIWASPPCTYFSVASIGKHWNKDHQKNLLKVRKTFRLAYKQHTNLIMVKIHTYI